MFTDTKTRTVVFQTVEEIVAQIATERSWKGVQFNVQNDYPGWRKEEITDFRVNYIPDWVQRRLDVILKSNIPVSEILLFHEPEIETKPMPEILVAPEPNIVPSKFDEFVKNIDWEKVLSVVGIVLLAACALPFIFLIGFAAAAACSSSDPACVIVIDDGTPQGLWVEVGRWV